MQDRLRRPIITASVLFALSFGTAGFTGTSPKIDEPESAQTPLPAGDQDSDESGIPAEVTTWRFDSESRETPSQSEGKPQTLSLPQPQEAAVTVPGGDLRVIGVTWQEEGEATSDQVTVTARTYDGEGWSDWQDLPVTADAPDHVAAEDVGTDPLVVIDAEEIEVRIETDAGEIPSTAELAVIDSGDGPAPAPRAMAATSEEEFEIYTRADWGADESIRTWAPTHGEVTGAVIHHTAGGNDYTAAQVPGIIRGIYQYHAKPEGRGWGDIGYNVLVDRFGRAWEGRYGGFTNPVIGGHAVGYNATMFGISVLGNFETTNVSSAALETVANVIAMKFALHDVTTEGQARGPGDTKVDRIVGHRDVAATLCPGADIYSRIGDITDDVADYLATHETVPGLSDVYLSDPFAQEISWLLAQGITSGYNDGTFRPKNNITREAIAAFLYRHARIDEDEFEPPTESPFSDVSPDDAFYTEITWLVDRGIATGYENDTFRPARNITREAMAAFLYRYAEVDVAGPDASPFEDVAGADGFYDEITWLADREITTGYEDDTFRPKNEITREAMAAFLYRYSPFGDITIDGPFYRETSWLAHQGITGGYADGTFRPRNNVTRESIAAFLFRYAGGDDLGFTPPTESPFTDVSTNDAFYKQITWLVDSGIASGYEDGTFRRKNVVTREAIAAFLYRHAGFDEDDFAPPAQSPFTDVATDDSFYTAITWLVDQGITAGYGNDTFRPQNEITREAMAAFLYRYSKVNG